MKKVLLVIVAERGFFLTQMKMQKHILFTNLRKSLIAKNATPKKWDTTTRSLVQSVRKPSRTTLSVQ